VEEILEQKLEEKTKQMLEEKKALKLEKWRRTGQTKFIT